MKTFTMYRKNIPPGTHDENQMNSPDEPQFEGVIFNDGACVIRWRTAVNSTSVFASFDDLMKIHGHPEYDSEIIWHDAYHPS